ncbi:MAG: hypothetical protein E7436_07265 [Ruminococcaceae bacterium]|nr:hypothetical protein [Oscillospiraceae bacterium]
MSEEILMEEYTEPAAAPKKKFRIPRRILRYYTVFFGLVLGLMILALCLMTPLRMLLEQYESAQPDRAAENIYELLFEDPDWELLYDMAKLKGTDFEGRSTFAEYMERKVGDGKLRYVEVSDGTSDGKRYSVRLGKEEIAVFTTYAYDDGVSSFPLWTLDEIEVYCERTHSVTVNKMPGYTVYINGVPLDEDYTVLYVETLAENYLAGDLDGYHYVQQYIDGLLMEPDVVVVDENNDSLPLYRNPVTGIYSTEIPTSPAMTEEERQLVLRAAEAELQFSVRKMSASELRQFFETNSPAYIELNDQDPVVEKCVSYRFIEDTATVTDFYRYSPDTFSAKVFAEMQVGVSNGDKQVISIELTYMFTKNNAGKYMATERIFADLQQEITSVLVHYECDGEVLGSFVTDVADTTPAAPMLQDRPDGEFLGWGRLEADGSLKLIMTPFSETDFRMVEGEVLTFGTLYPVYDDPEAP